MEQEQLEQLIRDLPCNDLRYFIRVCRLIKLKDVGYLIKVIVLALIGKQLICIPTELLKDLDYHYRGKNETIEQALVRYLTEYYNGD